ncbi:MurR/RpiR family transcriptional regulator [Naumannella sp. ID2617S]|uniref:RpiR family transcriptional regulator n=2 Tax=Enemella dayhoffiae TaxID=2016507 RepID=A0A255H8F1_9ACTN|nr:MurR/RpiR family transcriptional regulator [Naumannella sp. ID2617S]OYO23453.1 RpiR family transcriptional regulator [Enemella dayhoffiae]
MVRLRAVLPTLKPAEARVARAVLDLAGQEPHPTIQAVADRAETSTATVVRLFQRLGYGKFNAFWMDLTLDARRDEAVGASVETTGDVDREDSLADIVAKVYTNSWLSLDDTARHLDTEELARAIEFITGAVRVDLFGAGAGAVVVHDLQQKLARIGLTALAWPDAHASWTAAAALPPGAVALGVSHSGETRDTVEFLRIARGRGARTIALTNHRESALCEHADVVLLTAAREEPFRSGALGSRTAQLMVLDCLFIGVAQANYDASMDALRSTFAVLRPRRT